MFKKANIFEELGLPSQPIILAPLAGVSDHPFRRMCGKNGADLTYVEMISATALNHDSPKTLEMLARHPEEKILGVQVTSKTPEEMGEAVRRFDQMSFETIDINMGCPVKKVVKSGCGSAILKDLKRVYATTKEAVDATSKPVSVKIRLGWDHQNKNFLDVGKAVQDAGARWITVHGRTRSDSYGDPVDLEAIGRLKEHLEIPVVGNGNLFFGDDCQMMGERSAVDGFMVSRGALGNPWMFDFAKGKRTSLHIEEWLQGVKTHLEWQSEAYKNSKSQMGVVCMRKHILWYAKGWPGAKKLREKVSQNVGFEQVIDWIEDFAEEIKLQGHLIRDLNGENSSAERFIWDPKWEMDRKLDRGVGHEGLDS